MSLQKIISNVQLICEAIASVVNIDVTIVDADRIRLAGTGRYKESVGEAVGVNSAFSYALREGLGFIIENPGEHQACIKCDCKNQCDEHAEVCCPIRLDGETIGVIGLIAFKEDQKRALIDNKENLMSFLDRMADLISAKLKEFENHESIELLAKELEVVVDSLDTSLIAADAFGNIIRVNKKLLKTFNVKTITHIDALFEEREWRQILRMKENSKNHYHTFSSGLQGVYDVALIKVNQKNKGFIITIKSIEEVMNTVNDMMLDSVSTGFDLIVGKSDALLQAKELARKIAKSSSTVLVLGESGTGKELFARAIHHSSLRSNLPFVAINCAAIPDHLLESELFGYDEGAFTGARRGGKPGKFQLANKGTLFLDEIGDMPLHLQVKLLRVLQEKRIDRLGGNTPIDIDVRVIAATHRDLEEKVLEGSFRQDLYYRLNVIPIIIPPLRARKDDLLLTAEYLINKWCGKLEKSLPTMSRSFIDAISKHDWPGNVRELENVIEYAVNVCDDARLELPHLPKRVLNSKLSSDYQKVKPPVLMPIAKLEEEAIRLALETYGRSANALEDVVKVLGISRATLYRKIKFYNL